MDIYYGHIFFRGVELCTVLIQPKLQIIVYIIMRDQVLLLVIPINSALQPPESRTFVCVSVITSLCSCIQNFNASNKDFLNISFAKC